MLVALVDAVSRLATRAAKTEADVQSDVRAVLLNAPFELDDEDLVLESPVGGGRRIDVELGATAIEVKKQLDDDAAHEKHVDQLAGYIATRAESTGQRYVGILTDGVLWELYRLGVTGETERAATLRLRGEPGDTEALSVWLEGVLATAQNIRPSAVEVERRLGATCPSFALDVGDLRDLYQAHRMDPDVAMKRELWARLLASALGTHFQDTDELFVLHTYLVVTAELVAHTTVGLNVIGESATRLLSGALFRSAGLRGVVEPDFFDWPAETQAGERFVARLSRRISRFDWSSVDHDVLKSLYESVIDAETRKQLGEYYTPDWLAEHMVDAVIDAPLDQRVLDPACGSGTFLFWTIRKLVAAAEAQGLDNEEVIERVVDRVFGVDLHPVAVALARVTYLLALGPTRLQAKRPPFSVPVYLGDSVRWEQTDTLLTSGGITVHTSDGAELFDRELYFPERVIADAGRFDQLVGELAERASARAPGSGAPGLTLTLNRYAIHQDDREAVSAAFKVLCELHDQDRDHIWGYYIRNLARPLWFTQPANRVDVLVGNPPWLSYRFMSASMQQSYAELSRERGLWAGGKLATHQDLSDLFVVRAVEQYLAAGGRFAFVMPAAALSRQQYAGFRTGHYQAPTAHTEVAFATAWDMRAVRPAPLPVPCAVVSGMRASTPEAMPREVRAYSGAVKGRRWAEVEERFATAEVDVEQLTGEEQQSPYAGRFYQGATILPRILVSVSALKAGPIGVAAGQQKLRSVRSPQAKDPWKQLDPLEGVVESEFVRPMYVGVGVAPFLVREHDLAVIPWDGSKVFDDDAGELDSYPGLAAWWREASQLWEEHKKKADDDDGGDGVEGPGLSLTGRLDYHHGLANQLPPAPQRVVYTKAGNRICAARVSDPDGVIDHTLYWAAVADLDEALYLTTIFNSQTLHSELEPRMAEGNFGKRHIDKYVFLSNFPLYDPGEELHRELAGAGATAEEIVAAAVPDDVGFRKARSLARDALAEDEVGERIEELVASLLEGG